MGVYGRIFRRAHMVVHFVFDAIQKAVRSRAFDRNSSRSDVFFDDEVQQLLAGSRIAYRTGDTLGADVHCRSAAAFYLHDAVRVADLQLPTIGEPIASRPFVGGTSRKSNRVAAGC